ncbi:MAG: discoidin domain-containing protein [Hungatella hathewayi]
MGRGAWQNWGDGSQNTNAWVSYTWDSPKVITGSDAFFAIDGNQNFFPKSYYLEYLDENGQWRPLESTSGYKVVMSGYSNVTFNPVVTTGLRLTMTPSKDGSAILKWKVYGWNYGLSLDVTSLKELSAWATPLLRERKADLLPAETLRR